MTELTPEQEATYALDNALPRDSLRSEQARVAYDRLLDARFRRAMGMEPQPGDFETDLGPVPAPIGRAVQGRSSPEVRQRILEMFKRGNRKYAMPFERDRLAVISFFGGNWEEYGQVVLQMAILDTLLAIEEALTGTAAEPAGEDT